MSHVTPQGELLDWIIFPVVSSYFKINVIDLQKFVKDGVMSQTVSGNEMLVSKC